MKVFMSYRRSDNDYLVHSIHERLELLDPTLAVFLDVESIASGDDFSKVIEERISTSDVVIAVIGPSWQSERLHDPQDFVRRELEFARREEKRVIPLLHGGRTPPSATELPPELGWLPYRNALSLHGPRELAHDVRELHAQITNRLPELKEIRDRVWALYERNDHVALDLEARAAWQEHGASPSPALAECCRIQALSLTQRSGEAGERDLWLARALSTAFLSGASNAFAASLLPFFFRLMEKGEVAAAREVVHEIGRVTDLADHGELPPASMMRRLVREKTAYSYAAEHDYIRAREEYERALELLDLDTDLRGALKLAAGIALCDFALGNTDAAIDATEAVRAEAEQGGFVEMAKLARHNLQIMRGGDGLIRPYEVT